MISHFAISLSGLTTIRAFGNSAEFTDRAYNIIDSYISASWHDSLFTVWVALNIAGTGALFTTSVAASIILRPGLETSLAGFALAFALQFRSAVMRIIRLGTDMELDMNAAERIFEYRDLALENEGGVHDLRASWPEEGKIEVKDLEVAYADDLPSILKGLNFTAKSHQRIGVVGRTGAGESVCFCYSLFNIYT
jgi:ABC-type multidrug transport system fused ATPase/permease subunit